MSQKIKIYIAVAVILSGALSWYLYQKRQKSAVGEDVPDPAQAATDYADTKPQPTDSFPLKVGSKGKRVEQLQLFLQKKKGMEFPKFGIDGKFKAETLKNLKWALDMDRVNEADFKRLRMTDMKTFVFV